jgi:Holliday junction resolvasome RuvABC ATP-dependent DNA helicase subunit
MDTKKKKTAEPEPEQQRPFADLRPKKFSEYIGQEQVVETLQIAVEAARRCA